MPEGMASHSSTENATIVLRLQSGMTDERCNAGASAVPVLLIGAPEPFVRDAARRAVANFVDEATITWQCRRALRSQTADKKGDAGASAVAMPSHRHTREV
eukprot:NODE_5114_length_611_cov_345.672662.p3 GENE.NODE_5114_length_611_cov_345.672662~~NODE_5114_length_611_cov_345.672662.p3  ORF type:complete len:101 (-),score=10.81 NODE_5114_length_611_cov_345.672662:144-446(-)